MKNFFKLVSGLGVQALAIAVARQPELWNANTLRTKHPGTPHAQIDDIWLRFATPEYVAEAELSADEMQRLMDEQALGPSEAYAKVKAEGKSILDEHESVNYPAFGLLPQARSIVFDLMRLVEGERLGRVIITRMRPGARITPHVDGGSHAAYYDRYHVALQVRPGVQFRAGDEFAPMVTGDVWWFDNTVEHEIVNNSDDDRITLIVDIRTMHGAGR